QREVYAIEKQMLQDSLSVIKAGAKIQDVHEASLQEVKGTPYEEYIYANIGHGIGMYLHETPMLTAQNEGTLEAGHVVAVEPGIYIPGWGGIRIEDQILVTETGFENMISLPHELIEL
ncbi:MAG: M24 family metallopeptidase, partial [Vagococcus sp.]